jgi:NADPH-dependent 2,4-dienoyl-CoA reductase/sulfur reductase-like enzyme/peroxiredoxin family protein/TusA-related sulfurtransferase/rhodanese-related sulfurtransferase
MRLVIVGGVAAGASAAARARRLSESASITLLERGPDVSFANCGLPYHIGGEIADRSRLAVQTPAGLEALLNISVRTGTEAVRIDRARKVLRVREVATGREEELAYDKLLLAPGASPLRPPLPGIDDPRILTLRNLEDMDRIKASAAAAGRVLVIGAGFIGLEMAEQLKRLGKEVVLVEMAEQVLPLMDREMTQWVEAELRANGVELVLGDGLASFEPAGGRLAAVLKSGARQEADLVVLSIGVKPEGRLAEAVGLKMGQRGSIWVNEFQQTSDPDIYAAGDAVETADRVGGGRTVVPLGGPANRQGRLVADHIFMPEKARPYAGSQGTAIVRVFDAVAGLTGWTAARLAREGIAFETATVTDFNHAGYYPGAVPVTVKIVWRKEDGRLLGAQVAGADGVDKRLDVLATAIAAGMKAGDLADLELAYAPPFGSARDVVNTAGFAARNIGDGLVRPVAEPPAGAQMVDVRPVEMVKIDPLPGSVVIPFKELRKRKAELDRGRPVVTICAQGKTSYFAARILGQAGFDVASLTGGLRVWKGSKSLPGHAGGEGGNGAPSSTAVQSAADLPVKVLDATGLACPGPILKVREALGGLQPGQALEVRASDPGFAHDIAAFCKAAGLPSPEVRKEKGIVLARLLAVPAAAPAAGASSCGGANPDTTLVVFSQEMDKVLASLVIANGAAAMGGKVTMFFTFWGLNALRKDRPGEVAGKTWMDRMFGFMMPQGPGKLPLSNMDFGGMGRAMMKWRMGSKGLPTVDSLLAEARKHKVRMVACSMSMEAMGIKHEELFDGVEVGGVADFMGASAASGTNLFI